MHLTQWFIVVSLFWFGVEGNTHQRFENGRRSIGDKVVALRHRLVKRGSHIVGNLASINPCLSESLSAKKDRSKECTKYKWITMNGRQGALNDAHMRYLNRFGSKGKVDQLGPRQFISTTPGLRKEYRCLTDPERQNLHNAFNALKSTMVSDQNQYDIFVLYHTFSKAPEAHFGPAFCPWHREYLHRFEQALQEHSGGVMLPFWDNRLERRLKGNVKSSVLFSDDFMGNADGSVTTGFAKYWNTANYDCSAFYPNLYRDIRQGITGLFKEDTDKLTMVNSFQNMCTPWNTLFEDAHGGPHNFIGGLMSEITCSPNDPMFYLHHCFVDNYFQRFKNYSLAKHFNVQYPDISGANLPSSFDDNERDFSHNQGAKDTMLPFFDRVNEYGLLNDTYTNLFYHYDISPGDISCTKDSDCCNSKYLWCDNGGSHRCISKVVEGGFCEATFPDKACYCKDGIPSNNNGQCQCTV